MVEDNAAERVASEADGRRTRRAILIGALGGFGAWAAAAIARPQPGQAAPGDAVILGEDNVSDEPTSIRAEAAPASTAEVTFLEPLQAEEHIAVHADVSSELYGVAIQATGAVAGHGVKASSFDGTALYAESDNGYALETVGRVTLHGHSGIALIPAGRTSVTVPADVRPESLVTMSPMVNLGGRSLWYTKSSRANTLTFHISAPRSSTTRLTWHMLD